MGVSKKKEEKRGPLVVFCVVANASGASRWQEATCAQVWWSACSPSRRVRRWSPPKTDAFKSVTQRLQGTIQVFGASFRFGLVRCNGSDIGIRAWPKRRFRYRIDVEV